MMLRREIREFVFITTLMLLFILFCHLNFTNTHGQLNSKMKEFADYAQGRNLKSYWEHRKSMKKNVEVHYRSETLPGSVINHVNRFFFFVGYARSVVFAFSIHWRWMLSDSTRADFSVTGLLCTRYLIIHTREIT